MLRLDTESNLRRLFRIHSSFEVWQEGSPSISGGAAISSSTFPHSRQSNGVLVLRPHDSYCGTCFTRSFDAIDPTAGQYMAHRSDICSLRTHWR